MKYSDLREPMSDWLARQLTERAESSPATKPTGELALGDGDLTWRGPGWVADPDNPGGPLIPGPSWETWSVKEVPRITETLAQDLADAETRLTQARDDLAGVQDAIAGVTVDIDGLNASVGQAAQDAATAQSAAAAAQAAATQAATDAADALEAAQNASGKQQIYFGSTPPAVGDPDVLWIDDAGVPHQWDGSGWVEITDARIVAAAQAAQQAHGEATAAQAAAAAAQSAADAAQGTANSAVAAAGTAQTAADNAATVAGQAATAAATAAGIAGGKADVLIQNTAPAAAMRKATTLWIDTTGGANTPKRWTTGTTWVAVTDKTAIDAANTAAAAQAAATAAAAAALAAHQAADAADVKAGQALTSASGRNSRIISLNAPSGTVNPTTGLPLVTGDTWWRWDTTTDRNVIGAWVWRDNGWRAETLTDSVLGSLDVNKLLVLGTARITEAVVQKIMGDAAYFNLINVEDLTVTGDAVINELVAAKIAAAQITLQVLRSEIDPVTGLYAVFDSFGLRVIDNDGINNEGDPETLIKLGPDADQFFQLGTGDNIASIDSTGNVTGQRGSFREIWMDGKPLATDVDRYPQGVVAQGEIERGKYSRALQGQDQVLGLEATLRGGRVYLLSTSAFTCGTNAGPATPMLKLHRTFDGSYPGASWTGSQRAESVLGNFNGFRTLPPMQYICDMRDTPAGDTVRLRAGVTLQDQSNTRPVQVSAVIGAAYIRCEDLGTQFPNRGTPYYDSGGGGEQTIKTRTVRRWYATGWRNYTYDGSAEYGSNTPTQGRYSTTNRETIFLFDSMTSTLSGATIFRITLRSFADHWYSNAGGTGRWHWHPHTGGFPGTTGMGDKFMIDTSRWPRGAAREINLIPSEFSAWRSGARSGFGFRTSDTSGEFYGKFSGDLSQTYIEVDFER